MSTYEIINHGYGHPDYFQGCGTAFTRFEYVATGVGNNAKDAYSDAVDGMYQAHTSAEVKRLRLPTRPRGIRKADQVPASDTESFWYVSIRYTL